MLDAAPAMPPRDLTFLDHLASLLELERQAEVERIAAARRELSLAERAERGLALVDLVATDDGFGLGGRVLLTLQPAGGAALPLGRIDAGDVVTVRPRRSDVAQVPTAVVARRSRGELVLAFEQPPPAFVHAGRLVIELEANDVTHARLRGGLLQVRAQLQAGGSGARRLQVLLGQAPPRRTNRPSAPESGEAAPEPTTAPPPLNPEQREAVEQALCAEDFYLVHGPPGTGKSHVLVEIACRAAARGERILCTAASNAAVDHLLELCAARGLRVVRLGHPARVAERLHDLTLSAAVERHPDRELAAELFAEAAELRGYARKQRSQGRSKGRFANARQASRDARELLDEARAMERRAVAAVLAQAQVVCATLSSLPGGELAELGEPGPGGRAPGPRFDWALLDEATQATEPLALLAVLRARRLVLAGDPCQLPPTVLSQAAQTRGLAVSLLERLLDDHRDAEGHEPGPERMMLLREQHRMHRDIMAFPSQEFYAGALRCHPEAAARTLLALRPPEDAAAPSGLELPPFLFLDTAGKGWDAERPAGSDSFHNPGEAELLLARVRALLEAGLAPRHVGVIAPYSAQVALLRALAPSRLGAEAAAALEIDSVDGFQGREKEAVLVSLVRAGTSGSGSGPSGKQAGGQPPGSTGIGFLADLRRLNVALTRARRHLVLIGDSATLGTHPCYARLLAHAEAQGAYRSVWELDVP